MQWSVHNSCLDDYFRYELKFENGKLKSVVDRKAKVLSRTISGRTNTCIDWYLITTVYYFDGSSDVYEEFLFTSCNGDPVCQDTRNFNGRSLRVNCAGGQADGIDFEYEKRKFIKWPVKEGGIGGAYIESWETIRGKASTSGQWPGGGYFVGIVHNTSWCYCPQNGQWDENPTGTSVSLTAQGLNVHSTVKGTVFYLNSTFIYENSKTWFYSDIF